MPEVDGKGDLQPSLDLGPSPEQVLPPLNPPKTHAPFQFNQQVNIQRIPPKVWDRLSAEQIVDLSKTIIDQVEKMDGRQFELAMEQTKSASATNRWSMCVGGLVAIIGIGVAGYLATHGNGIVAGILATFLATILAVIVGSRLND